MKVYTRPLVLQVYNSNIQKWHLYIYTSDENNKKTETIALLSLSLLALALSFSFFLFLSSAEVRESLTQVQILGSDEQQWWS